MKLHVPDVHMYVCANGADRHSERGSPSSGVPSQSSSKPLQVSACGMPGVQVCGSPPTQRCTVRMHSPVPQEMVSAGLSRSLHAPGVVPVQVPGTGAWQVLWQSICNPPRGWSGHIVSAVMHAPAPLQAATKSLTSCRRKHASSPAPKPS